MELQNRKFAVIENNTVVNIVVGIEDEVVAANPGKYIEYTYGWEYPEGTDGGIFFPAIVVPSEEVVLDPTAPTPPPHLR